MKFFFDMWNITTFCILQKTTLNLIFAVIVTVVGSSFQFGYNSAVINAPQTFIEQFINETFQEKYETFPSKSNLSWLYAVMVSIFAIGGMIGSFVAGFVAERLGRKKSMLYNNILVLIAVILMASAKIAQSYEILVIGRFFVGLNSGINTGLAPLYLVEIAPISLRGTFGTMNQLGVVTSMLIAQVLGIPALLGTSVLWPYLFIIPAFFALFQIAALPFCPDSPVYLLKTTSIEAAEKSLIWLRPDAPITDELNHIQHEIDNSSNEDKVDIKSLFKIPFLLKPLLIAIVLQCSQQLTGINAILYYSTELFVASGVSTLHSTYITVGVGFLNVVICIASAVLVDKYGRRTLLLIGLGGMFFSSGMLTFTLNLSHTVSWHTVLSIVAVMIFVVFFQVGPGSIPWFITAELFKENARSSAVSVAGLVNWTGNFIIGLSYPPLQLAINGYTFAIFAATNILSWLFTYFKVPETKGKSPEEIAALFQRDIF